MRCLIILLLTLHLQLMLILLFIVLWHPDYCLPPLCLKKIVFSENWEIDALSNGAISAANASQSDVFLWTINHVYLNVFCLCQAIYSVLLYLPLSSFPLLSFSLFLSLSLFLMYSVVCLHACVLTAVWTVLQAKVQRLFLRVRIWTIMSGTQCVCSGGARVWNWP